jgi:predicted PurR-regulated permease PerM
MDTSFLKKSNQAYLFVFFTIAVMILAKTIIIPIVFAGLLSLLVLPIVHKIEKISKSKILGALAGVLTMVIAIVFILLVITIQLKKLVSDFDFIESKMLEKYYSFLLSVEMYTGMDKDTLALTLNNQMKSILTSSFNYIQEFVVGLGTFLFSMTLVFLYCFFIILYRSRIKKFLLSFVHNTIDEETMTEVFEKIKKLVLNYLTGLLLALFILGCMNALGLFIIGIEHGIFLGMLAGFLNIIPYVGSFIGGALPIIFALIYKDGFIYPVIILAVFMFNQFIDNNFTTPKVVGGYVKVNPFATILAVFIGGMIWGVVGMILFIPLTGIFKIICDTVPSLNRFSLILGEED